MEGTLLDGIEDSALGLYEVQPTSLLVSEDVSTPQQYEGGSAPCEDPVYYFQQPVQQVSGQQVAAFQTPDGQLVYITYSVQPDPVMVADSSEAMSLESLARDLLLQNDATEEDERLTAKPPKQTVTGPEVGIEEKLEVRDAMLGARPGKNSMKQGRQPDGRYVCDLCEASFRRPAQLYGHLHSHTGERVFPCILCAPGKFVFAQAAQLAKHERRYHRNVRRHVCDTCGDSFDRVSQLGYHTRRIHLQEKPHSCQICSKGFFKQSDLKTHLNVHLGISTHTCPTCGKHFGHVSNLTRHLRTHTGFKPYVCSDCGRRFSQPGSMVSHKMTHSGSERVACLVCPRNFKSLSLMRRHVRLIHPTALDQDPGTQVLQMKSGPQNRRYYCAACGASFQFATQLHSHELLHTEDKIHCSSCRAQLLSVDHLKRHCCEPAKESRVQPPPPPVKHPPQEQMMGEIVIYVSREGETQPTQVVIKSVSPSIHDSLLLLADEPLLETPTDQDKSLGPKMGNDEENGFRDQLTQVGLYTGEYATDTGSFLLPDVLDLEDVGFSGPEDLLEPPPFTKPNEPEPSEPGQGASTTKQKRIYHCGECGKQFTKVNSYKQHMGIHFVDQQRHTCPVCERVFAWRSTLNKHMVQHSDAPAIQYSCEQCDRHYPTTAQVQEHVKRDHNKERSHVCTECNKAFYKRHDLKLHTRTHTKERPYMCGTCGKCFYHPSHIIRHERSHLGVRAYACHCGRRFTQSSSLHVHKQSHHPSTEGLGGQLV